MLYFKLFKYENLTYFQFLVTARDQSQPERTGTATVRINVLRSTTPPSWINNAPYVTSVNLNTVAGTIVYTQSRARDVDLQV